MYEKYVHYCNNKFDHLVGSKFCKVLIFNFKILCDLVCFTEKKKHHCIVLVIAGIELI